MGILKRPESIEEIFILAGKLAIRYGAISVAAAWFVFVYFGYSILSFGSLDKSSLTNFCLTLFFVTYIYFDNLIRNQFDRVNELKSYRSQQISKGPIAKCIESAATGKTHVDMLRVYALTSGEIYSAMIPLFKHHGLRVDVFKLMICNALATKSSLSQKIEDMVQNRITEWRRCEKEGDINSLEISSYEWMPIEYFIIFDNSDLVYGRFIADPDDPTHLRVKETFHIQNNDAASSAMIKNFSECFDKLNQHGSLIGVSVPMAKSTALPPRLS
jgi:hypothetical protein